MNKYNNIMDEVIEWLLNTLPLVNKDYTDILAERTGYIFNETKRKYIKIPPVKIEWELKPKIKEV